MATNVTRIKDDRWPRLPSGGEVKTSPEMGTARLATASPAKVRNKS
jgi:hypothetical protein